MRNTEKIKIKNWDRVTKWILGISILIILFSFVSPLIFTATSRSDIFDFTETGQIGDTIGGIINPFIALAGVLLTFLAFYMQIKANQIQITQFKEGLEKEKEIRLIIERKDYYNKLSLLKVDLTAIKSDIESKAKNIKEFFQKEKEHPFQTNYLIRTPSKNYSRIVEIDRLSIFNGFNEFLNHRESWIKEFSNLYNILDFLPELFNDLYDKYENHSKDMFEKKMLVRNGLIQLMDRLAELINNYLRETNEKDYLKYPASELANETIFLYYKIIEESFDENRNPIKETNLIEIDENILKYFNQKALAIRKGEQDYDIRLDPIVELISNLRKQIYLIKQRAIEFSESIESQYNNLMIDDGDNKSYLNLIIEIHSMLDDELSKVKIEV
ncbi:hypothetical protein V8V91_17025 [Algoriphagus halophilus]|uniref:hypothetical protein n=1 Tax=Algoriphagus halophilus TaxID=226505 RepID=UPI00358E4AF6